MDDFSDFGDLTPTHPTPLDVAGARGRLRSAVVAERRRLRRRWFLVRSVLVGTVVFTVWSIAPTTTNSSDLPLIGLAQATARLGPMEVAPGEHWYVREERSEWISLTDATNSEPLDVTVRVDTVAETWVDLESSTVRQTRVSQVESLAPDDRQALELLEASEQIDLGRFESEPVEINYPGVHPMWAGGVDEVYAELERQAGSSGDIRLDRVSILRSAAILMQQHGADPAKRSALLLAISRIPGIEVEATGRILTVRYQYVKGSVAHEIRYDFDQLRGELVGESVSTLATPTAPAILLSQSRYEARLAIDEASGS